MAGSTNIWSNLWSWTGWSFWIAFLVSVRLDTLYDQATAVPKAVDQLRKAARALKEMRLTAKQMAGKVADLKEKRLVAAQAGKQADIFLLDTLISAAETEAAKAEGEAQAHVVRVQNAVLKYCGIPNYRTQEDFEKFIEALEVCTEDL